MGIQNLEVNELLKRREIFADLVNGSLHHGRQILKPEDLTPLPPQSGAVIDGRRGHRSAVERTGDIRMKADSGTYSVIFAGEVQANTHYAMPVRNMLYDALEYTRQVKALEKQHRERKDLKRSDEFLSGISKEDRIRPVINTILFTGKAWDGSETLHGLLAVDPDDADTKDLLNYIPDYRINLIPVRAIEEPKNYRTCLQQIFSMIKYKEDKEKLGRYVQENREAIDRMDSVELSAALEMFNDRRLEKQIEQQRRKEGEKMLGLSQAITDMLNDSEKAGQERGEKLGFERGEKLGLERGEKLGLERGEKLGLERGEKLGLERGEKLGLERGEKLGLELCSRLMEAGRMDDMKRIFTDQEFRESLYEKYGIQK